MIVQDVIRHLETLAPIAYAEEFDNVGLLVGDNEMKISGILVTLDTLEAVVDEAIEKNCNMIVSFHPIIFKGLKSITGKTYVERVVIKALKNNIAIYAIHTALDNALEGVNATICTTLGIQEQKILIPQKRTIKKLTTYVPEEHAEEVKQALFNNGAGQIGNYSNCSFCTKGEGTFEGNENSNPIVGQPKVLHKAKEVQVNVTYQKHLEKTIISSLFKAHPYEEVAYEVTTLDNNNQHIGMGMVGSLKSPVDEKEFLDFVAKQFQSKSVRHSPLLGTPIQKVAVLGGSGSFAIEAAKATNADAFISADLKYHDFFTAEDQLLLIDVGHYESEQYTKNLLVSYLTKKIPNFAVVLSNINTNPVNIHTHG